MTTGDSSNMAVIGEELTSSLWLSCTSSSSIEPVKHEEDTTWGGEVLQLVKHEKDTSWGGEGLQLEKHKKDITWGGGLQSVKHEEDTSWGGDSFLPVKHEEDTSWGGEGLQPVSLLEVKKLFCCPVCGKGFAQRHNLVKHQRIHSGERPYSCDQCGKSFIQKQHLTKHQRLHTGERPYVCQVCGRGFSLKHNLTTHLRIHTGEKPYPCTECGKNFSRRVNLRTHQISHQKKSCQENKLLATRGANLSRKTAKMVEKLPDYHNLREKRNTEYAADDNACSLHPLKDEPPFLGNQQQIDNVAVKTEPYSESEGTSWDPVGDPDARYELNILQIDGHPPKQEPVGGRRLNPRPFICPECGKRFANKQTFVNHYRIHTGQRPYECPECGRSFVQKQHLTKHLRVHSGERPYVCGQCDRSFSMKHNLFTHLKIHSGEKPFSCSTCNKKFSRRSSYLAHQGTHYTTSAVLGDTQNISNLEVAISTPKRLHMIQPATSWSTLRGLKTYKCHVCAKVFKQKHPLITHLRIHSGERPFSCQECGKNFIQKQHLTKHLRLHSGERPFTCQHCGKQFNIKHNLITHQRTHTGERPFSCLDCGKSFNRQGILNVHRRTQHVNLYPDGDPICGGTQVEKSPLAESPDLQGSTAKPHKASPTSPSVDVEFTAQLKDSNSKSTSQFSCPRCGQIFGQREDLVQHEHLHKGERLYACSQCGKRFLQKKNLTKHQRLHMGYKPFTCSICNRSFSLKHNLITHQRTHTGEKPFLCAQCGRSFSRRETLNNHRRSHHAHQNKRGTSGSKPKSISQALINNGNTTSDDQQPITSHQTPQNDNAMPEKRKPTSGQQIQPSSGDVEGQPASNQNHIRIFICPMCGKSFNQKHTLINHLRIHSGERPYSCHICRKSFIQKQHLTKHVRLHTGERPYACEECGRSFSLKHNLTTHQRIHTGERPYPCNHCGKRFNRRSILLSHEKTHQLVPPPPAAIGELQIRAEYLPNAVIQTMILKEEDVNTLP